MANDTVVFFTPASLYCYVVGYNIIKGKEGTIKQRPRARRKRRKVGNKK